jgi:hypothetical protein
MQSMMNAFTHSFIILHCIAIEQTKQLFNDHCNDVHSFTNECNASMNDINDNDFIANHLIHSKPMNSMISFNIHSTHHHSTQ